MHKNLLAALLLLASANALAEEVVLQDASLPRIEVIENATELEPMQVKATPTQEDYAVPNASMGTKTDTPIMQTPLNVQVIPEQVLVDQNATTLEQALKNVSGVYSLSKQGWQEVHTLRGFVSSTIFRNGFRIDSNAANSNFGGLTTITNTEKVEVLKGPAAILYGRVEPGGVINVISKQPLATPYYSIEQQLGSWQKSLTNIDATGPVNEDKTLLYRVNASYDSNDSWREAVGSDKFFIAPSLTWNISPQTQAHLEVEYTHDSVLGDNGQMVPFDTVTNKFIWLPRKQNLLEGSKSTDINTTYVGFNLAHQFNDDWQIKYQIMVNNMKLNSDRLYLGYGFFPFGFTSAPYDFMRGAAALRDAGDKTNASILDLTGHFKTGSLKHTVLLGGDFYIYKTKQELDIDGTNIEFIDPSNPPPVGPNIDLEPSGKFNSTTKNYGLYVQDQIELPGNVHVLGGLRYQKVKRSGTTDYVADAPQSDHDVTPRVGILWQPHPWLSLYANYTENFGANTGRDWQSKPLNPETAQQKEIGIKTSFFEDRLKAGLSLFDLTKQNVATLDTAHLAEPQCIAIGGCSIAIGEVNSKGVEFDLQGEIYSGLNMIATYAYTDIQITKSKSLDALGAPLEGHRMENVPRNMASLWATYTFKQDALQGLKIGGGATYTDSTTDRTNTIETPSRTLFDAMAAYDFKTSGHKVTAQINIHNIFDKKYYMNAFNSDNTGYINYGAPRSATASLRLEF